MRWLIPPPPQCKSSSSLFLFCTAVGSYLPVQPYLYSRTAAIRVQTHLFAILATTSTCTAVPVGIPTAVRAHRRYTLSCIWDLLGGHLTQPSYMYRYICRAYSMLYSPNKKGLFRLDIGLGHSIPVSRPLPSLLRL